MSKVQSSNVRRRFPWIQGGGDNHSKNDHWRQRAVDGKHVTTPSPAQHPTQNKQGQERVQRLL